MEWFNVKYKLPTDFPEIMKDYPDDLFRVRPESRDYGAYARFVNNAWITACFDRDGDKEDVFSRFEVCHWMFIPNYKEWINNAYENEME